MAKLKIYAIIAAVGIITCLGIYAAVQGRKLARAKADVERLERNQAALLQDMEIERNKAGDLQATVNALTLRRDELERLIPVYVRKLDEMSIRLKEVQSVASIGLETVASVTAKPDTVFVPVEVPGPAPAQRRFIYSDDWLDAVIDIQDDSVSVQVQARDSLTVVAHRERRKCLFKKPKIVRYTAVPASPYTRITGLNYVETVDK